MLTLVTVMLSSSVILSSGTSGGTSVAQEQDSLQAVVEVKGLACPFCVYGIQKHLRKLPKAHKVRVELGKGQAIVDFAADSDVTEQQIKKAVRDAGFTTGEIQWKRAGSGNKGAD